ncbi:MAG: MMPL family transporter [Alphaproteobacteria bacterium]|nr:MMPL family transporter [Alphaproteobacteria bacterium]
MKYIVKLILQTSVARPIISMVVIGLLAILAAVGVLRIQYEDGLKTLFSSESPAFQDYKTQAKSFTQNETNIAVLVETKNGFNSASLTELQDFILEVQFVDGITAIRSIFSLRRFDEANESFSPLLPSDLNDKKALGAALKSASGAGSTAPAMISNDLKQTVVILSISPKMSEIGGTAKILHNLRQLTDEFAQSARFDSGGLKFGITGLLSVRASIIKGLKTDQMRINLLGAVLGFIVSLIAFRSFWVAAVNTITPVAALLFSLGAFGWLGMPINVLTNALPVLILVLASSDSIHITYEIRRRLGLGEGELEAIKNTMREMASPSILTSLTTILAFSSLFYSQSPIIRDLALAGASGVFIALVVVLFLHPLVFVIAMRVPIIRRSLPKAPKPGKTVNIGGIFHAIIRHSRSISVIGALLSAGALWVLLPLQTSYRFLENIDTTTPAAVVLDKVEKVAGPISSINIPLRLNVGVNLSDPSVNQDLAAIHRALEQVQEVRSVLSVFNLLERATAGTSTTGARDLSRVLALFPDRVQSVLISKDQRELQVLLMVPDNGSRAVARLVKRADRALAGLDLKALKPARPTGFLVMSSTLSDSMIRQLTISFLIAALSCPILIGLWFRRVDFALAAVIPNILPIAFVGGLLTLTGQGIQLTSALALTIAFGIALDDSIHVFNRLDLIDRDKTKVTPDQDIWLGMVHISPVLVTTTAILSAGIMATQVSVMPMIRLFGLLCIATFALALLCDLVLLPAIISWLKRPFRRV